MMPKVLVISNECFSQSSSNGRTLGNFFVGWPKESLAQFSISGNPDNFFCDNYYITSDREVLNAFFSNKSVGINVTQLRRDGSNTKGSNTAINKRIRRNALTMLARNIIWKMSPWKMKGYWEWVHSFQPDVVLLQAGDCGFMYNLAVSTAEYTNSELIIYNSEDYYFKDYDYFRGKGISHFVYPVFRISLRKAVKKTYGRACCAIYICNELKELYLKEFKIHSETVYTGSDIVVENKECSENVFHTVYCGNLGLKRYQSLIDIANVLQDISKNLFIDVYGNAENQEDIDVMNACRGIRYHGIVPYKQVRNMLRDSDLILHVESFDDFYQKDVKFGFSTKIADSLASGNCFLLYAPAHFACFQYLKTNEAAYTISNIDELRQVLNEIVIDSNSRVKYKEKALYLAKKNHDIEKNNSKFQDIICSCYERR